MSKRVLTLASLTLIAASALASGAGKKKSPAATPMQRFNDYVFEFIQRKELTLTDLGQGAPIENADAHLKTAEGKKLTAFYSTRLPKGMKAARWSVDSLDAQYHLPTSHPVGKLVNRAHVWALGADGTRLVGFRPIDTTTGCDSSCTPVVFHLMIDTKGRTLDLIEEPKRPLRKAYHQVLNPEDRKKALALAQRMPEVFRTVGEPKALVDWDEQFPPQTWTTFSSFTVKDAAFTSYRILEAAVTSHRALNESEALRAEIRYGGEDAVGEYLRIGDFAEGRAYANAAIAAIKDPKTAAPVAALHTRMLPYLMAWMGTSGNGDTKLVRATLGLPVYAGPNLSDFCGFGRNLMANAPGREFWSRLDAEWKDRPRCGAKLERFFKSFVTATLRPESLHVDQIKDFDLNELPAFVRARPELLLDVARALPPNSVARVRLVAVLEAYYPGVFRRPQAAMLAPDRSKIPAELKTEIRRDRVLELERKFLTEKITLPALPLRTATGRAVGSKILSELPNGGLIVFFASWCPHCQSTVGRLVSSNLSDENWNRITFVEVFPKGQDELPEFCSITKLPEARCQAIYRVVSNDAATDRFLEALGISSVPRAVLVGAKGQLLVSNFDLEMSTEADANEEFALLFEAARAFKGAQLK